MISSVLLILAVVTGFIVVMTKDMAPATPKAAEPEKAAPSTSKTAEVG